MVHLLELPEEVILQLLAFLSPRSLCQVSLACRTLMALVREEKVWLARARLETGLRLQPTPEFSARQFYQNCLHRLGPLLGLWEMIGGGGVAQLLRLIYRDESIVAEVVSYVMSALDPVNWEVVMVIRAGRDGSRLVIQSFSH